MVDPVFSMLRLKHLLAPENTCANDMAELEERERKRRKVNESLNIGSGNLTDEVSYFVQMYNRFVLHVLPLYMCY